jgi:hypothetical protein
MTGGQLDEAAASHCSNPVGYMVEIGATRGRGASVMCYRDSIDWLGLQCLLVMSLIASKVWAARGPKSPGTQAVGEVVAAA